jgi:hypothetical protein
MGSWLSDRAQLRLATVVVIVAGALLVGGALALVIWGGR